MWIKTTYQEKSLAVYPGAGLGGGNRGRYNQYDNAGSTARDCATDYHVAHHHVIYWIINWQRGSAYDKVPNFSEDFIYPILLLPLSSRLFCLQKYKQFYAIMNLLWWWFGFIAGKPDVWLQTTFVRIIHRLRHADPAGYDEAEGNAFTWQK